VCWCDRECRCVLRVWSKRIGVDWGVKLGVVWGCKGESVANTNPYLLFNTVPATWPPISPATYLRQPRSFRQFDCNGQSARATISYRPDTNR